MDELSQPSVLKAGKFELNLDERTQIMGILNITTDSFSDGEKFYDIDKALAHARSMAELGADIIDIGGESTRPGSEPVSLEEEIHRTIPVIENLATNIDVPISIDTYKAEVARRALDAGATIVNDISGLRIDNRMVYVVAEHKVPVIIMHMQGTPRNMQKNPSYQSVIGEIGTFLKERAKFATDHGVKRGNIIIDPGIGFGKTVEHNLEILNKLKEFKSLGYPICLGTSRKSFIGLTLDVPVEERLMGTAATVTWGIANGANIMRVHDVQAMAEVAKMTDAIKSVNV